MLGLGLSLTVDDFKRVVRYPKAILIGLFIQMFVLTSICFAICVALKLPSVLAVGMMLLAAAPGGATANIYSHLAKGDVALNITLTAVNSVLSLLTLPVIVGFALQYFMGNEQIVPPPFKKVVEVGVIILGPVLVGMLVRAKAAKFAAKMEMPIRLFSDCCWRGWSSRRWRKAGRWWWPHLRRLVLPVCCLIWRRSAWVTRSRWR